MSTMASFHMNRNDEQSDSSNTNDGEGMHKDRQEKERKEKRRLPDDFRPDTLNAAAHDVSFRISTFDKVKNLLVSSRNLAESGFYYDNKAENIICFYCGLNKRIWAEYENDKIEIIHRKLSRSCPQVACRHQPNVPETESSDFPDDSSHCADDSAGTTSEACNGNSPRYLTDGDSSGVYSTPQLSCPSLLQSFSPNTYAADRQLGLSPNEPDIVDGTSTDAHGTCQIQSSSSRLLLIIESYPQPGSPAADTCQEASGPTQQHLEGWEKATEVCGTEQTRSHSETQSQPYAANGIVETASLTPNIPTNAGASGVNSTEVSIIGPTENSEGTNAPQSAQPLEEPPNPSRCPADPCSTDGGSLIRASDEDVARIRDWIRSEAANPVYASVDARMVSFIGWPTTQGLPSPRSLVIAGFYCITNSSPFSVRCFFCGVTVKNCTENVDPWVMHVRLRFSCGYVNAVKGEYFVCQTQCNLANGRNVAATSQNGAESSSHAPPTSEHTNARGSATGQSRSSAQGNDQESQTLDTDSLSTEARTTTTTTTTSTTTLTTSDTTAITRTPIADTASFTTPTASSIQATPATAPSASAATASSATSGDATPPTCARRTATGTDTNAASASSAPPPPAPSHRSSVTRADRPAPGSRTEPADEAELRRLREINRRLSRRLVCRLCGFQPVNTIFLPCGHLCTCEMCASEIDLCCLCNVRIVGTARVFLGQLDRI